MGEPAAWLELELARSLDSTAAPESLWSRIERPPSPRARTSMSWTSWPVAAALMLVAAGAAVWRIGTAPAAGLETLAIRELQGLVAGSGHLDLRSEDPVEIRSWVKARTDIDIELPVGSPPAGGEIRLLGVRLIARRGGPIAAVDYRAGDGSATLLVSRDGSSHPFARSAHVFTPKESASGARLVSWTMRDQAYTIASSASTGPEVACLLCHAQPRSIFN